MLCSLDLRTWRDDGPRRMFASFVVCVVAFIPRCYSLHMSGELPRGSVYAQFAGKFCYDYVPGELVDARAGRFSMDVSWTGPVSNATSHGKLYMMLFDDERTKWPEIHKTWDTSTCEQKLQYASTNVEIDIYSGRTSHTQTIFINEHIRPRFWYMTFVACGIPPNVPVSYTLHATNDNWGWQKEFSYDRMGILPFLLVYLGALLFTTATTVWATHFRDYAREQDYFKNPYIQLLLVLCGASLASCGSFIFHYNAMAHNGVGNWYACLAGIVATAFANTMMLLIAALAGLGWKISGRKMPRHPGIFCTIGAVGIVNAVIEIQSEVHLDESTRLYAQESPVGVIVLLGKVLIFCWVIKEMRASLRVEWQDRLRNFYKAFGISFACWSLSAPIIVCLAFALDSWVRFKVVMVLEFAARLAGLALLGSLFAGPLSPILLEQALPNNEKAAMFGAPLTVFNENGA